MSEFKVAHTKNKINFIDEEEVKSSKSIKGFVCADIAREEEIVRVKARM